MAWAALVSDTILYTIGFPPIVSIWRHCQFLELERGRFRKIAIFELVTLKVSNNCAGALFLDIFSIVYTTKTLVIYREFW